MGIDEGFTKTEECDRVRELIHKEKGYKPMMDDLHGPVDAPAGDKPAEAPAAEPAPAPEAAPEEAAPAE